MVFSGTVAADAVNGKAGTLLLDPKNITIQTYLDPNALITNGSFETGNFSGWVTDDLSSPLFPVSVVGSGTTTGFGFFTSSPTNGTFTAFHGFDGNGPGTIRIGQDVTIPDAGTTTLSFDYRGAWDLRTYGATQPRTLAVNVQPAGGGANLATTTILTASPGTIVNDTGALTGTANLTPFAGFTQRVSLDATVPENYTGPAQLQIDNVRTTNTLGNVLSSDSSTVNQRIDPRQITAITNTGTALVLQASNDITIQSPIVTNNPTGNGGNLTLQAGRSILVNANLTTDNGRLTLSANDAGAIAAQRDPGAAVITMAPDTSINAGTGNVNISVGTFGTGGDVTLQAVQGGVVTVNNTGTTGTVNLKAPIVATTVTGSTATTVNVANTAKIQNGVDIVRTGGTVNAAAGTYAESVTIAKSQTVNGAGAGSTIVSGGNTSSPLLSL